MKWHKGTLGYEALDSRNRIWLISKFHNNWKFKCIIGKYSKELFHNSEQYLEVAKSKVEELSKHE